MKKIAFFKPNIDTIEQDLLRRSFNVSCDLVGELEQSMQEIVGASYAIASINSHTAFHLALSSFELKRGDKIIVSVNSHPLIAAAIRRFDAEPVFVDINEEDFTLDLDILEEVLSQKTKKLRGMVVSFLGGAMLDLDRIYTLARKYGVFVLEDATHAFGASYKGKPIGSELADASVISFSPVNTQSFGNGAIILTNNKKIYERATLLREYAITREPNDLSYIYDVIDIGFDYRLSHLNAAYCIAELKLLDSVIKKRKQIARYYIGELSSTPHILPAFYNEHNFYSFIIRIEKNRDGFARALLSQGVETSLQYTPLHMLSYYRSKYAFKINSFPQALKSFSQVLSIPIYARLGDDEIQHVVDVIKNVSEQKFW